MLLKWSLEMENNRIDLSPLDPSNDTQRWNVLIESIVERATKLRQRRLSFSYQLFTWAKPAFALAVALAFIVVIGASLHGQRSQIETPSQVNPTLMLAVWASTNERPSIKTIFELFRGTDEYK